MQTSAITIDVQIQIIRIIHDLAGLPYEPLWTEFEYFLNAF